MIEILYQMIDVSRLIQRQGFAIDFDDTDQACADAQAARVFFQEGSKVSNTERTPLFELHTQSAIVFKPQGNWCQFKDIGTVIHGRFNIHGRF